MQLDMHYYGTYAMARAAGLKPSVCKTIATCAQFVDDNAAAQNIEFLDGGRIDAQPTAHHLGSVANIDHQDQRRVWVPFHFLPGNEGNSFSERLICRKNSQIAKDVVKNHLKLANDSIGIHLIGVTAHVYADTFSHYGFSGVSSRRNKVNNDSFTFKGLEPDISDYIEGKAKEFFRVYKKEVGMLGNMKSWLAETLSGALGHGAVATYPDRPYLKWGFEYEYPEKREETRDNTITFLEGCEELHSMFKKFGKANPETADGDDVEFKTIRDAVKSILEYQASKDGRVKKWCEIAKTGDISGNGYDIPDYDPQPWLKEAAILNREENSENALSKDIYKFYRAASYHRHFVLRQLLPSYNLVVS